MAIGGGGRGSVRLGKKEDSWLLREHPRLQNFILDAETPIGERTLG